MQEPKPAPTTSSPSASSSPKSLSITTKTHFPQSPSKTTIQSFIIDTPNDVKIMAQSDNHKDVNVESKTEDGTSDEMPNTQEQKDGESSDANRRRKDDSEDDIKDDSAQGKEKGEEKGDEKKIRRRVKRGSRKGNKIAPFDSETSATGSEMKNSEIAESRTANTLLLLSPSSTMNDDTDSNRSETSLDRQTSISTKTNASPKASSSSWPDEINDTLTMNRMPLLSSSDDIILKSVTSTKKVLVRVITWNQQAHPSPPIETLTKVLLLKGRFHVIAIGTEECENTIAKSILNTSKAKWEATLDSCLGDRYVKVRSHTLQATHNVVFIHRSLLSLLNNINSAAVSTGLNTRVTEQLGNKGGIGISFDVGSTSFCFVNAHLAAHQNGVDLRDAEFTRISHDLAKQLTKSKFTPPTEDGANPLLNNFSNVFWSGDLNYRINGTRLLVDSLLAKNLHQILVNNDQLKLSMLSLPTFEGFNEGPLNFRPTYKLDKDSDVYDTSKKQRIPSWTDRVLFKQGESGGGGGCVNVNYGACFEIRTSDHRPVYATFECSVVVPEGGEVKVGGGEGGGGELGENKSQVCVVC